MLFDHIVALITVAIICSQLERYADKIISFGCQWFENVYKSNTKHNMEQNIFHQSHNTVSNIFYSAIETIYRKGQQLNKFKDELFKEIWRRR